MEAFFRNKNTLASLIWQKRLWLTFFFLPRYQNKKVLFQKKTPNLTEKHSDEHTMLWDFYTLTGNWARFWGLYKDLRITVSSGISRLLTKDNFCNLKLKRTCVMRQDNDPKHTSIAPSEWLLKIEILCCVFKWAHHARKPSHLAEWEQVCVQEWPKFPL